MGSSHTKRGAGSLDSMSAAEPSPVVEEVVRFEDLPLGSRGPRRALVRWSDGSEGEALTWYADEILICERRSRRQDARAASLAAFPQGPRLASVVANDSR
jgi:hypothetical protein